MMFYVTKVRSAIRLTPSTQSYGTSHYNKINFANAYKNESDSSSSSNTEGDSDDIMQCGPLPCVLWIAVGIICLFICATSLVALCICHLRRRQRAHMYERVIDDDNEDEDDEQQSIDAYNEHVTDRTNVHANNNNNNNNNCKEKHNTDNLYSNANIKHANQQKNAIEPKMIGNIASSNAVTSTKVVLGDNSNNNNNTHLPNTKSNKPVNSNESLHKEDNVTRQSNSRYSNITKNIECENNAANMNNANEDTNALKENKKRAPISTIHEQQRKSTNLYEHEHYEKPQQQVNNDKVRHGAKLTRNAVAKFNLDSPSQFQAAHVFEAAKPTATNRVAEHDLNQDEYEAYDGYYASQALQQQQQQQQHFAEPWQPVVVNRSSVLKKKKEVATNAQNTSHDETKPANQVAAHHTHKKESRRQVGKEKNTPYLQDDLNVVNYTANSNIHDDQNTLFPQHELSADDLMLKEAEFNTQMEIPASYQSIVEFKDSGSFFNPGAQISGEELYAEKRDSVTYETKSALEL